MINNPVQIISIAESANLFLAGPSSGAAAVPTFRGLTIADITAGPGTTGTGAVVLAGGPTFTGTITSAAVNTDVFIDNVASTAHKDIVLINTGNAGFFFGIEGATPAVISAGSLAYESVLDSSSNNLYVHTANLRVSTLVTSPEFNASTASGYELLGQPAIISDNTSIYIRPPLSAGNIIIQNQPQTKYLTLYSSGGLGLTEGDPGADNLNIPGVYKVAGSQIAASNLSNGTTGTGAVVLAVGPSLQNNGTGGSGTAKIYGIQSQAHVSSDVVGDRAYGGWFKAGASNLPSSEVALHAEAADAGGTAAEFTVGGVTVGVPTGGGIGTGVVNASVGYYINGSQIAASNLSNGTTGTGAVVLASNPVFPNNTGLSWLTAAGSPLVLITMDAGGSVYYHGVRATPCVEADDGATYISVSGQAGNWGLAVTNAASSVPVVGTVVSGWVFAAQGTIGVSGTSGGITSKGGIVTGNTSDERLKDSEAFAGGLDIIAAINPVKFRWNEAGQKHTKLNGTQEFIGFLAQNVQSAIPEAVTGTEGDEKYLQLDDRPIIAALVNAVKELTARIKVLESKQ